MILFQGDANGDLKLDHCFWLSGHRDTLNLFDAAELGNANHPLTWSEMARVKSFARTLKPSYWPSMEDVEEMRRILNKLEQGIS